MTKRLKSPWVRLLAVMLTMVMLATACGSGSDSAATNTGAADDSAATSNDDADEPSSNSDAADDSADEAPADDEPDEAEPAEDESAISATDDTTADEAAEAQATTGGGDGGALEAINNRLTDGGDPQAGGTLIIDWASDIGSLDPLASSSFNTHWRIGVVYQRLFAPDTGPDIGYAQFEYVPELATGLDISEDGLTYTVGLRDDVVWQNVDPVNGRAFECADAQATLQAMQERGFQASFLDAVTSIDCPDATTLVLNLSGPFAPLENYLGHHQMWILPQEAFDGGFDPAETAIGTGPFIMSSREKDVLTSYERNPDFWQTDAAGNQLPYLDGISWFVTGDTEARLANLRAGEVDVAINGLSPEQKELILDQADFNQYFQYLHAAPFLLGLNMEREEFQDVRVRQAISMAMDREGMAETIIGGGTYGAPVSPTLASFTLSESDRRSYYSYDLEAAQELLAEAGYPDGFAVNLIYTDRYGARWTRMTEWIAEDMRRLGLDVTFETLDYSTYFGSRWPDGEFDMQLGPQTPFVEPDEWLRGQYGTDGGRNWYNNSDPVLDELLAEQLTLVDPAARQEKILEIQVYIAENMLAPIPIWNQLTDMQLGPDVRNFWRHQTYGMAGVEHIWLDR